MKKILTTILAGTLVAGAAFADFSVKGNVRFESDVFTYTSPEKEEHSQKWGKGGVNWAKDTKHSDDLTLQASGDNVGAKIQLTLIGKGAGDNKAGNVDVKVYQGWVKDLFGLRLDAGIYDQRLSKNLQDDDDWATTLSGVFKTGIIANFGGMDASSDEGWGKDASNITNIKGSRNYTNFQVTKAGLLDGKLTVRGLLFLTKSGTDANGDNNNNDRWIFTPFALGATYALDKNTQLVFVGKLNTITKGEAKNGNISKADNSVYTVNFEFYKKLDSGIGLLAAYTFGTSLYSNWSEAGARKDGYLVRDYDVFAHGIDFRVNNIKLMDALTLTAIANVSYVQGTAVQKATNRSTPVGTAHKDSLAKSYATGAAGKLAYYASVSANYQQSDTVKFQVQAKIGDDNLFGANNKGDHNGVYYVDYLEGMSLIVRPGVLVNVGGTSQFFAGVQVTFDGFQQYATGDNNTFKVTAAVPVGLRIKL